MGMFEIVVARPNDADRLWPLLDEDLRSRGDAAADDPVAAAILLRPDDGPADTLPVLEARRERIVRLVSDPAAPVLIAYSGIRAVGFALMDRNGVGGRAFTSAGWRGLGVEEEIRAAAPLLLR
ncbi:hypothetical protein [Clavibacter michiganensis]|uniref:Uncharacterized protein n=1 Tax=Clavibacter michiganensis subsp. michiganensis (strain NCPPB 382) TaxID=443906 RepID=A5CRD6_CLAM3|nr:hypothetical protein [Clavibacter michiganensis]KAF0259529.1 hypothetical protein DOU02_02735 [Clavibacter michiganensis subsp. michiganensis]MBF4636853.1 hypothetical protein [Clavibacter michiganensis subsp. michiganensis]MBW8026617.1 hypothetical protein [Clavibacter michiganensis subsp. michiganensis]MDO4019157.1 hypothetical protein [Clavibacter michiganensis]MDO4024922.1 hypothetical protein [Clavibacter michiganensis]